MSESNGAARRLARARETDRRYHSAISDLDELMKASQQSAARAHSGASLLATMVDVPLEMPRAQGGLPDGADDIIARPVSSQGRLRRAGSAYVPRTVEPLPKSTTEVTAQRCNSALAYASSGSSGGLTQAPARPSPAPVEARVERSWRPSASPEAAIASRGESALPADTSSPWSSASRSGVPTLSEASDSRPTSQSGVPRQSEQLTKAQEHLAAALAERGRQRDERRRQREQRKTDAAAVEAQQEATSEGAPESTQESPAASPSKIASTIAPGHADAQSSQQSSPVQCADAEPTPPPSPPKPVRPEDVYYQEVSAIRTEAADARQQRLAAELAERRQRELAEQRKRAVVAASHDLVWDETNARECEEANEARERAGLHRQCSRYTAAMDVICCGARQGAAAITADAMHGWDALARAEAFDAWVEGAAAIRVEEMDVRDEALCDFADGCVALDVALLEEQAREDLAADWAAGLEPAKAEFGAAATKTLGREQWLLVNEEATQRMHLEADERDGVLIVWDGCTSSRALVQRHHARVLEARSETEAYHRQRVGALLEDELAARLLLQRAGIDGLDRIDADERFARADAENREQERRKAAVEMAIREAQLYAMRQTDGAPGTNSDIGYQRVTAPPAAPAKGATTRSRSSSAPKSVVKPTAKPAAKPAAKAAPATKRR